jgi:hypothetical protein
LQPCLLREACFVCWYVGKIYFYKSGGRLSIRHEFKWWTIE